MTSLKGTEKPRAAHEARAERAVNGSGSEQRPNMDLIECLTLYTSKFRLQGQSLVQHFKSPNGSKHYSWGPPRWIPIFMGGTGGGMVALIVDDGDIANP